MYLYRAVVAGLQHLTNSGDDSTSSTESLLSNDVDDTKRLDDQLLGYSDASTDSNDVGSADVPEAERDAVIIHAVDHEDFKLRAYQDEMLAESLQRNTIVVLNTGAGKTHIALARIRAELESDHSGRLVWFLVPTVALCHQHYKTITTNLPAYRTTPLTGEDGVDRWTDQLIWDGVLKGTDIAISTYAVLYDALCHGFVKMSQLSLCVFDEAHHCTKKHPSNMIMQHFYWPAKSSGQSLPGILGLSASPVMNAKSGGLEELERNMDSHVITPRLCRSELMQFVHVPELLVRSYKSTNDFAVENDMEASLLGHLTELIQNYDIRSDPHVLDIMQSQGPDMQTRLNTTLLSRRTYCMEQLKGLRSRAEVIARDVSVSASDAYIRTCRDKFLNGVQQGNTAWLPELSDKEKSHLAQMLTTLRSDTIPYSMVSPKTELLLKILKEEAGPSFTGIVFVQQRAVVAALADYVATAPETSNLFNVGTFVGTAQPTKKNTSIGEISDLRAQQETLDDFRARKKSLIFSTNVLEEGIDVQSCQTVICFDAPPNLVSYIQRRGRARMKDSKYIILHADDDKKSETAKWKELEEKMKATYEYEIRNAQLAAELEQISENDGRQYKVESTEALLTLDNAKSHLHHFCATLQANKVKDSRPIFSCRTDAEGSIHAEVLLPAFVNKKYRRAVSAHGWRTERAAVKDAAFEAYVGLHRGKLLNDHLLPLYMQTPDQARQNRPGLIPVPERLSPWSLGTSDHWYEHLIDLTIEGQARISILMTLPIECPAIESIVLHWSSSIRGVASVGPAQRCSLDPNVLDSKRRCTEVLLRSVLSHDAFTGMIEKYAALFEPLDISSANLLDNTSISAREVLSSSERSDVSDVGLVRFKGESGAYVLRVPFPDNCPDQLSVVKFPRKRDFLSTPVQESKKNRLTSLDLATDHCTIDILPARFSIFAACIPSILHRVQNTILATHLQNTVLRPVGIKSTQLIIEATTSGAADHDSSYERLEYLGDAVLKYCTHVQLLAQHPDWPESYLTAEKGRTNGNASLSRAALKSGVDRFILTGRFTGHRWKPPLLRSDGQEDKIVQRSTKILADVVEALTGDAFVDQGLSGAIACIKVFLPQEQWYGLTSCHSLLFQQTSQLANTSAFLDTLEELIGHRFANPALLLEAVTHASFSSNDTMSYERLEFLGDAVLDQLIVPIIFAHEPKLQNHEMHRMRQALANAHILGFLCFELSISKEKFTPVLDNPSDVTLEQSCHEYHLHDFLRCNTAIHKTRQTALNRHAALRSNIHSSLHSSQTYPWPDLFALHIPKWASDLIESILGAIYIDTQGDMTACTNFADRVSIFDLLMGFLGRGVEVGFPKESLGLCVDREKGPYPPRGGEGGGHCEVWFQEERVVGVEGCVSREEAEVRGASEAVEILKGGTEGGKVGFDGDGDGDGDVEMLDVA